MRAEAMKVLDGVGDENLGQWEESGRAYHVRRRLSGSEVKMTSLSVRDIRKTPEYGIRRAAMGRFLPPQFADWQE